MNYDDELRRYEEEAEDRYDDYDDEYEDDFYEDDFYEDEEDDFYEEEDDYATVEYIEDDDYDGYDDSYDSYTSNVGKIDANDRTLTIVVSNTSDVDAEAIIFGGNESAAQADGVAVVVEESSHKEVREESKGNPFKIAGMKMSVSNPLQFDNVLKVTRRTATGSNTARVYQPRNATSPQNFTQQLIDDAAFEMDVTGQDSLRLTVKAQATVVFTFTIRARANMGNLLKGNNVAELSQAPRTTGLPQLDLLQQKKKRRKKSKVRRIIRKRPKVKIRKPRFRRRRRRRRRR